MGCVKRIVKRVAFTLGALVLTLILLWYIGVRWGFTPLPKPPRGVRIEPLSPPLARKDLKPDNGAFYYAKATDLLNRFKQSKESEAQMNALLAGDFPRDTRAIEQTLSDCRETLDLGRNGSSMNSCQMPCLDLEQIDLLAGLRQLARLLVSNGKIAEHKGDADRAINDYFNVVKLGTDCSRGGTIILNLVGTAITSMGTQAIRGWALQNATSPKALENIIEKLNHIDSARVPFAETFRYELAFAKEQFDIQVLTQSKPWQRTLFSKRVLYRYYDAAFGDLIQDAEKPFWKSSSTLLAEKWSIIDDCKLQ